MAIPCPEYDPTSGNWHVLIMGPYGLERVRIISPSHYYSTMGVNPPVGFNPDVENAFDDLPNALPPLEEPVNEPASMTISNSTLFNIPDAVPLASSYTISPHVTNMLPSTSSGLQSCPFTTSSYVSPMNLPSSNNFISSIATPEPYQLEPGYAWYNASKLNMSKSQFYDA